MSATIHSRLVEIAAGVSPELHEAIRRVGPVKLRRRSHKPFPEVLCRVITGQQLSVRAAETIWDRVVSLAGKGPIGPRLGAASFDELRGCGLSAAKAKTIAAISQAAADGRLDEARLRRLPREDREAELTAIWGVGRWTADMMGMFYFGDRDIWPDGDTAARKRLQSLAGEGRPTAEVAAEFAPHRSYLAMSMWRWADADPVA